MTTDRLLEVARPDMSVLVGTVDAEGMPATCRGVAVVPHDDEVSSLTVFIPVATGQQTIANIATSRRIAVSLSQPIEQTAIQLKGTTRNVRLARGDEEPLVRQRIEEFAAALEQLGLPRHLTRSLNHWPAFAVDVQVEQIFNQTPGPKAGNPLT